MQKVIITLNWKVTPISTHVQVEIGWIPWMTWTWNSPPRLHGIPCFQLWRFSHTAISLLKMLCNTWFMCSTDLLVLSLYVIIMWSVMANLFDNIACRLWAIVQNHFKRYPKPCHNPLIHEACQIVFQSFQNLHIRPLNEAIYCHHYELIGLWGDEKALSNQFPTLQMFSMLNWVQMNLMPRNMTINLVQNIWHTSQDPQYPHCIFEKCWLMTIPFG